MGLHGSWLCKVRNRSVFFLSSYALYLLLQQVLLLTSRVQLGTKAPAVSDKSFSQFVAIPLIGEVHSITVPAPLIWQYRSFQVGLSKNRDLNPRMGTSFNHHQE
jgi:hypothetical protein